MLHQLIPKIGVNLRRLGPGRKEAPDGLRVPQLDLVHSGNEDDTDLSAQRVPTEKAFRRRSMIAIFRIGLAILVGIATATALSAASPQDEEWQSAQILGVPPAGADMFQLNDLEAFRRYSRVKNFEIVGHSYLRGPWVNPAFAYVGMAMNTMRVCDSKVAYLAGYNPIVFGVLIVDVSNPADMKPLSFIPAHPGMKTTYLRVSCARQILAFDQSGEQPNNLTGVRAVSSNPSKPKPGEPLMSGVSFYEVSDPSNPKLLGEWHNEGGLTHGMEMD